MTPSRSSPDLCLGLVLLPFSLGAAVAPWLAGIETTTDDGFYYLRIAQNIAVGAGSTFDGIHPTNGYHPLWMFLLVPIFWLCPEPSQALVLVKLSQTILFALATSLVYGTARFLTSPRAACLAALCWIDLGARVSMMGLEFALHCVCLFAVAGVYIRRFGESMSPTRRDYLVLGTLSALTFLARIESILLVAILAVAILAEQRRGGRLLLLCVPSAACVIIYLLTNLALFDHFQPVSSAVKRAWSIEALQNDPIYIASGWLAAKLHQVASSSLVLPRRWHDWPLVTGVTASSIAWVAMAWVSTRHGWGGWYRSAMRAIFPFLAYSILSYASFALVFHGGLSQAPWYFAAQPWVAAITLCVVVERGLLNCRSRRKLAVGVVILLMGVVVAHTVVGLGQRIRKERFNDPHPALEFVLAKVPEHARIGAWRAGTLSYLSQRQVINLDGLVNSWRFWESGRHDLCRYWEESGISYLVDIFEGPRAIAVDYSTYQHCRDRLELMWSGPARGSAVYRVKNGEPMRAPLRSFGRHATGSDAW